MNIINQVAYLRTSREFPEELQGLTVQVNKSYIDIANAVNNRIIGLFPTDRSAVTGENWFVSLNQRNQSFRQVYVFTSTAALAHGLSFFSSISYFTRIWGQFTDGTNWYGLIAGSNVAIAGQISFYLSPANINFLVGAGAPTLTRGIIVLEWISNP